ncbi:MAG: hypothetical protein ACK5PB_14005 [Pirellula sp.]|jgi:hypothetical protein
MVIRVTPAEQNEIQGLFPAAYHASGLAVSAHLYGVRGVIAFITEKPSGRYTADMTGRDLWRMSPDRYRSHSVSGWVAEQMLYSIQHKEYLHPKDLICSFTCPKPNFLSKSELEWTIAAKHSIVDKALRRSFALLTSNWSYIAATALHLAKMEFLSEELLAQLRA